MQEIASKIDFACVNSKTNVCIFFAVECVFSYSTNSRRAVNRVIRLLFLKTYDIIKIWI